MKIVYGTNNKSKVDLMKEALINIDIELLSLKDFDINFPDVVEDGSTPLENARIKAKAYYDILKMPVFSCDSGLYIDNIPNELQPGLFVRRVNGKVLTDKETQEHYMNLAKKYGNVDGELICRYQNGICFIIDNKNTFESMDEGLSTDKFIMSSVPHQRMDEGFPLDSLSKDIKTGKYYHDMPGFRLGSGDMLENYKKFFENSLSKIKIN